MKWIFACVTVVVLLLPGRVASAQDRDGEPKEDRGDRIARRLVERMYELFKSAEKARGRDLEKEYPEIDRRFKDLIEMRAPDTHLDEVGERLAALIDSMLGNEEFLKNVTPGRRRTLELLSPLFDRYREKKPKHREPTLF